MIGRVSVWLLPLVPKQIVRAIASRYVAGESLGDAVNTVKQLNSRGVLATIDILGEDSSEEEAQEVVGEYLQVIEAIIKNELRSGISIKPSHFGARLSEERAFDRIRQVVSEAAKRGVFVRLDMEDSTLTDLTLQYYFELHKEFENVGVVIQAYLHRSRSDLERLAQVKANVRLCKGIYKEDKKIAFRKKEEIRQNYIELARYYLTTGGYLGIATHDRRIIATLEEFITKNQIDRGAFEFQSLLGVPIDDLVDEFVGRGFAWRVYVPFGRDWYPYSVRRLKENPKIASYVLKHLFGGKA